MKLGLPPQLPGARSEPQVRPRLCCAVPATLCSPNTHFFPQFLLCSTRSSRAPLLCANLLPWVLPGHQVLLSSPLGTVTISASFPAP